MHNEIIKKSINKKFPFPVWERKEIFYLSGRKLHFPSANWTIDLQDKTPRARARNSQDPILGGPSSLLNRTQKIPTTNSDQASPTLSRSSRTSSSSRSSNRTRLRNYPSIPEARIEIPTREHETYRNSLGIVVVVFEFLMTMEIVYVYYMEYNVLDRNSR